MGYKDPEKKRANDRAYREENVKIVANFLKILSLLIVLPSVSLMTMMKNH